MPSPSFDLSERIALVTGSSRGIGTALAAGLLRAGATVVLNGRAPDQLAHTADLLVAEFGEARVRRRAFDVTDPEAVGTAMSWIEESVGALDILVNNAGVQLRVPLLELDPNDWDQVIRTNLTSAFLVGREAARAMLGRRRGKIVNIGSVQSELARPTIAAYTAAKGGLRNLTRAMAAEWASSGLQVNSLAPGYIATEMTQALQDDAEFNAWVLRRAPAGRWGTPQDLVGPLVWLASSASDYVNGQTIYVDGGMTAVV